MQEQQTVSESPENETHGTEVAPLFGLMEGQVIIKDDLIDVEWEAESYGVSP